MSLNVVDVKTGCTADPLFRTGYDIARSRLDSMSELAPFADFGKAYDTVWQKGLMYKLCYYYTKELFANERRWRHSYLKNRSCFINHGTAWSSNFSPKVGVPQGDVLRTIVFTFHQ